MDSGLVHVTRAGEGRELRVSDGPAYRVVGSHGTEGAYTAVIMQVSDVPARYRHYGERLVVLFSGSIIIKFGEHHHHHLVAGDTLHYSAHETHEAVAHTDDTLGSLLVIASPALF